MKGIRTLLLLIGVLIAREAWGNTLLTSGESSGFFLAGLPTPLLVAGDLGYAIYVPPGATRLTIQFVPGSPALDIDLLVRFGFDVGFNGLVGFNGFKDTVKDFCATRSSAVSLRDNQCILQTQPDGTEELVITPQSTPSLQSGTYFIGFIMRSLNVIGNGLVSATVEGGSPGPTRTVAISAFDTDLDGWTRNNASTSIPGSSQGDPDADLFWVSSGGNPGGYIRHVENGGAGLDTLLAPSKFLGDWSNLSDLRFEFDFKQIAGFRADPVQIRIFGAGTAFAWQANIPPVPPDDPPYPPAPTTPPNDQDVNPPIAPTDSRWRHYTALLSGPQWTRLTGEAKFSQVLANLQRIEVITDLSSFGESEAIDNFALLARGEGPPSAVLAGNTSFASGPDGWDRNYSAADLAGATSGDSGSTFRWVAFEGNPNGYIRLNDAGGPNRDYVVVPSRFLGDYRGITNPQIEFDYVHLAGKDATLPLEARLIGAASVFVWTGPVPTATWTHYIAPLRESMWQRVSGTAAFADALANVQRIEISMDQAEGPESNGIDNFWVLPASVTPAPPALSANPRSLSFVALARGDNPQPQPLRMTSIGGGLPVSFSVAATGANWLKISSANGTTPRSVDVSTDITGLAPGTYNGRVTVVPVGPGMAPQTVDVSLTVAARPGGIPRINKFGAVNAASNWWQLAPGGLASLYGSGFGPAAGVAASYISGTSSLPTRVQGVRVIVNDLSGALIGEAPLLYVGESQINFQLPFEAFGRTDVWLVVDNNGAKSDPYLASVVRTQPGIFTYGESRAVAVNQDNTVNSAGNAAPRGSILTVYMTGQGVVTPEVPSGNAAPLRPLARSPLPARAWIGGAPAQILFIGLTPGLVGVLQVNLVVPEAAPSDDSLLAIEIAGRGSNTPLVTVR